MKCMRARIWLKLYGIRACKSNGQHTHYYTTDMTTFDQKTKATQSNISRFKAFEHKHFGTLRYFNFANNRVFVYCHNNDHQIVILGFVQQKIVIYVSSCTKLTFSVLVVNCLTTIFLWNEIHSTKFDFPK